jgi:hypothetical protein
MKTAVTKPMLSDMEAILPMLSDMEAIFLASAILGVALFAPGASRCVWQR